MIELILSLLVTLGFATSPPPTVEVEEDLRPTYQEVEEDLRPTYQEVECYIGCMGYCLWEAMP